MKQRLIGLAGLLIVLGLGIFGLGQISQADNLTLLGVSGGGTTPATITLTAHAVSTSDASTYTYTAQSVGTADSTRVIIVGSTGTNTTGAPAFSSVTVCGNTATSQVEIGSSGSGAFTRAGLFSVALASGTSCDIVVTFTGTQLRNGIGVWAAYGLNSATATATNTSTANPATATLNISAGGVAVGYEGVAGSGAVRTFTWTNLTEDFDETTEPNGSHTGASGAFGTAQTGLSITSTPSGAVINTSFAIAAFR